MRLTRTVKSAAATSASVIPLATVPANAHWSETVVSGIAADEAARAGNEAAAGLPVALLPDVGEVTMSAAHSEHGVSICADSPS